ncbi:MarR family winged helix-turn-helix transcriptional regulator [Kineococcus terrestris]|uniref:MarR family winged helix-turn-helix transcriptional regulator n=1 Tax=Kineococcus terrestris TaxID=2044856 RepID=UPI0034DB4491
MTTSTSDLPAAPGGAAAGADVGALAADVRVAVLRTARRLRATKSDDELSDAQFSVLAHLHTHGPRTPGELAEAEHVRAPSMTRTLAALEGAGLLERTAHPTDRRQVLVSASAAGRATVEATRAARTAWLTARLQHLSPAEREVLAEAARLLREVVAPA